MKNIRIVSPAKHIDKEAVFFTKKFLQKNGFKVDVGKNALGSHNYFSGTLQERLADFQEALDDENVDFILCARGGYGSIQLIDLLNFNYFLKKPKLIIGYSDITVFHNHIFSNYGIQTVHATAPLNFSTCSNEALNSLLNVLNQKENLYKLAPSKYNCLGNAEGIVIGGNLAIVYSLLGTNSDVDFTDKILFLEEVGEAIYAVDRMFYSLKKSGKLAVLKGVLIGGLTAIKDSEIPFGKTVEEVIHEHVSSLCIPVAFNFPAGHIDDNRAIVIGKPAKMDTTIEGTLFLQ